ncbi:MAG: DDE-type integrase/transposase/recombinase [Myxococcales bacterium]|nr:DDE-type integrase/transposase/recombinase [Myxococcales bacterium]
MGSALCSQDTKAAKLFLGKLSRLGRSAEPLTLTVDRHPSYPAALSQLQSEGRCLNVKLRQSKFK